MQEMLSIRIAVYRQEVEEALKRANSADIAVAFASEQGLNFGHIKQRLEDLLKAKGSLRVILDLRLANTEPDFIARLLDLQSKGLQIQCRCYTARHDGVLHPKLYIFSLRDGSTLVISGSANWTAPAYTTNIEHGLVLEGEPANVLIDACRSSRQICSLKAAGKAE